MLSKTVTKRNFSISALKAKFESQIAGQREQLMKLKKDHSNHKLGDITVGSVLGGMRGNMGLIYEPSKLHHLDGINYRGHSLNDMKANSPATIPGGMPNPEGMFWLLLTGEYPNQAELAEFMEEINHRSHLREEQKQIIRSFPKDMHPMTQFSAGMMVCQPDSHFAKAYASGIHKTKYWEEIFEDSIDVCAKTARVAALVYQNHYGDASKIAPVDPKLDFSANFAKQIGYEEESFAELMRLYFVIHADHEGGNVSAHATHLVGSALSDPYLSFSAGLNGLAGPLHGLAN
jgi:citrate synthase